MTVARDWLSTVFGLIFAFNPVEAQWKPWIPHTGISYEGHGMAMGIANIAIWFNDSAYASAAGLALADESPTEGPSAGVCVASIVRVYYLSWTDHTDLMRTQYPAGIWTVVEATMSILCACLPTIPILIKAVKRRSKGGIEVGSNGESTAYLRPSDGGESSRSHGGSYKLGSVRSALEARDEGGER
ncbi:hypothetical protein BJX99DRAFT_253410 [Aspergillus californicus]